MENTEKEIIQKVETPDNKELEQLQTKYNALKESHSALEGENQVLTGKVSSFEKMLTSKPDEQKEMKYEYKPTR